MLSGDPPPWVRTSPRVCLRGCRLGLLLTLGVTVPEGRALAWALPAARLDCGMA